VSAIFQISLHKKDQALLERIQLSLGGIGKISKQSKDSIQLRVFNSKDLAILIDHLDRYPLITQKRADYELFKQGFELINRKEHLNCKGLQEIVAIKASMNNGLSASLKEAFPNIIRLPRPKVVDQQIKDPHWLAGFHFFI
jgi:hypothetical protein